MTIQSAHFSLRRTCNIVVLVLLFISSFILILPFTPVVNAEEVLTPSVDSDGEQRYREAKFYYNELLTNETLAANRENWEKGAQNFRRIYLADPKSELAAGCLFMLGKIYSQMYERYRQDADIDESISYYKDTANLFPQNRLADDAYYTMGLIYLSEKQDPDQAAKWLIKVVQDYPNGDMHQHASETLKQLSKDHDIALPNIMVGNNTQLNKLNYVLPVKYWSSDDYTRVVIMASGPVKYREELLQETENKPRRLYIDFQDSYIEPQYRAPVPIEDGLLKQIRTGQFSKDTVRVVLDIESIDNYETYSLPDPFRVVIDVRGKGKKREKEQTRTLAASETAQSTIKEVTSSTSDTPVILQDQKKRFPVKKNGDIVKISPRNDLSTNENSDSISLAQQLGLGVRRIVLDPGHGGKDPGAIANGLKEKDIVLQLAKQLQPLLEKELGCEVLLTRDNDTFISLEERTAIANTKNADLFISLHINAHPSSKVRGVETYYLNLSTNAEAMRVAAMENATSTHQMSDLQDILSDILQNSKINESSRLADNVHSTIVDGLSSKSQFGNIHNLGVKQAPFYVLIGAQMPAILIEIAFISNQEDAQNLKSSSFLTALAHEISEGIKSYMNKNTAGL